jgi:adenosine deaminase
VPPRPPADVRLLPKAHLHLHLVGGMRPATLAELAAEHGLRLPPALSAKPERLAADYAGGVPAPRGPGAGTWFRFQHLYDAARAVLRRPDDVRQVIREIAEDEAADGAVWVELQVDPSGYAARFGGLMATTELLLDAIDAASRATGVGMALIVAANRTRHPYDAATLARLAVRYAGRGVVGFGLSNNERLGPAETFHQAFRIARRGGLIAVPHGGELAGPASVRACLDSLGAARIGHGVRAVEDISLLDRLAADRVVLEVCPESNVALGVVDDHPAVPLHTLLAAGVPVALGADDPLLFGSRLAAQYETARTVHGMDDATLAHLAECSLRGSTAPPDVLGPALRAVADWRNTRTRSGCAAR